MDIKEFFNEHKNLTYFQGNIKTFIDHCKTPSDSDKLQKYTKTLARQTRFVNL